MGGAYPAAFVTETAVLLPLLITIYLGEEV
jgi:hypothetical protein